MRIVDVSESGRKLGFIAIDSTIAGRACGGLRMAPDTTAEELAVLAGAMTLKYGLLGFPQGGAKAGVIADPEGPEQDRRRALESWGRSAREYLRSRAYVPGSDMGTDQTAVRRVLQAAGTSPPRRGLGGAHSHHYTALGVFLALKASADGLGRSLAGLTAIIEGFGKVGSGVGRLLEQAGVRIVGASDSGGAIYGGPFPAAAIGDLLKSPRLGPPELLVKPADILIPCARHHSINSRNWQLVEASLICPGANCPLTPDAEQALVGRGAFVFPDFVANCGGVLGGTMEFAGVGRPAIEAFFRSELRARFVRLVEEAGGARELRRHATSVALERFAAVKEAVEHPMLGGRAFGVGLALFRHGWIPPAIVAPLALRYFAKKVAG